LLQPERDNNQPSKGVDMVTEHAFLSDVKTLRERARKHLEQGALGSTYVGDVKKTIELLQAVLATEIVCVLRYTQNSIAASGISSEGVRSEFAQHAKEEHEHALAVAERINQLGGKPNFNPSDYLLGLRRSILTAATW
jgi:bacterioferritin